MNADTFRLIAVVQGVACMLAVVAAGLATQNRTAWFLAIISLALAYISTMSFLIERFMAGRIFYGNIISGVAIGFGVASIMVLV